MRAFVGAVTGVAIVACGMGLAGYFWPWQIEATGKAGTAEVWLMRQLFERAVRREAPRISNPLALSDDNLRAGMKIFRDGCAGCHGDGTKPSVWGTTSFLPRVPQFATEPPHRPDWQIHWIVKNGIRNTGMGAWDHLMTDDKIWNVSMFVSRIGFLPPAIDAEWRTGQ